MDAIIKQTVREELRKQQETKEGASKSSESNEGSSASTNGSESRTVNRLSGLLQRIRNRRGGAASSNRKKAKIDKQHRIQIRWLHYNEDKNKYAPVRNRYGGGNRYLTYMDSDPLTLQQIQDRACELFFPKGKSHFGLLEGMSRVVTNSAGEVIYSFPGCGTIADYLNENGLYPSLTYLYLRTICTSEEDEQQNLIPETSTGTSGIENFDNCADQDLAGCEDLGVDYACASIHCIGEISLPTTSFPPSATRFPPSTTSAPPSITSSPPSTTSFPSSATPETLPLFSSPEYRIVCPRCFCTNLPGQECLRCRQDEEYNDSLKEDELKSTKDITDADEQQETGTTPVDINEIRVRRIAYLSRNVPMDTLNDDQGESSRNSSPSPINEVPSPDVSNGNTISAPTVMVEEPGNQQEFDTSHPPSSPKEVQVIKIHRSRVCKDMLHYFQDETITTRSIVFEIIDDRGKPEKGAGIGVARDVFSLFWKAFGDSMTIGERERVPFVRHDHFVNEWQAIGRILVHGYKMVSYFPLILSKTFIGYCLFGDSVPDSVVINSFKKYLSIDEEELVEKCLSPDTHEFDSEEIVDFLDRFNCRTILNENNCQKVITELAKQELIQKPHIMLSTWQPILSELKMFESFQSFDKLEMLYDRMKPTNKKVLQLLQAQPNTDGERDALKFLQRYVRGLDTGNLGHFLRFTTGADILIVNSISVSFVKVDGILKAPVAHTCGPVLELPCTFQDFCELRNVFNNILAKPDWELDIV